MKKNSASAFGLTLVLVVLFYSLNGYGADLVLDQGQEGTNYGFWLDSSNSRWQEFRPYYSSLSRVDIYMHKTGDPGNLVVSVKDSSGNTLWSTKIIENEVPNYDWLQLPVIPSVPVTPHSPLYIYVGSTEPSPDPSNRYFWSGNLVSEYYRGTTSVGQSWPNYDFAFRTWSDTEVIGRACFIHDNEAAAAQSYRALLEANGYPTTLISLEDVPEADFSACAVIIAGSDTGSAYEWGTPEAVQAVQASDKPILGLGFGGASLFGKLDLSINWGNAWIGNQNSIYVNSMEDDIFNDPYDIFIPRTRIIQLYNNTEHIGEYAPNLNPGVTLLGREISNETHYPLVQEGNNILWGFTASPDEMTITGKELFLNAVYKLASPPPPALYLSLNIEDALEGITVNKLLADADGPTRYTRLEVVTKIFSLTPWAKTAIPVVLSVEDNLLGSPSDVYLRDTDGGTLTSTSYSSLGGGRFQVTTDLSRVYLFPWLPNFYRKQIVWRFLIPNDLSPQDITINAELGIPAMDPDSTGTLRIMAPGTPKAIIITNRKLLYEKYDENEVSSLLHRLFTEAQGWPATHTPTAVIYYVERYDTRAYHWDNTAVDYTSENSANIAANAIDALIEDWIDDATKYTELNIPYLGTLHLPVAMPSYLLITGNDDTIPFYRYNDPYNEEHTWSVSSATNPEVRATDHDYFLTDNPYADLGGGTDWQTGDVEMWTGRLLGESAGDMLSLLEHGVNLHNGRRGGAVMASVAGWELGLEPDDGRPGEIADLADVTALLRNKGFAVLNDDIPWAEVRTIDVMSPYEGGNNSWNSNFRNAANNAGGMDIFFIGGHQSYDHALIPGDAFSPDDTPSDYMRFGVDHPLAMIVGCHGGLPVPDIDIPGGADHNMVYDLIHEGVRAYIGATGFSYGSPGSLHRCTWGERLIQRFFMNLTAPRGSNSMSLGKALAVAKQDYTFGLGTKDTLDRKTVTEFNLYGVPWSFVFYPNATSKGDIKTTDESMPAAMEGAIISKGDDGVYSNTVEFSLSDPEVQKEIQDEITYDLLSITGGDMAISPDAPVLPFVKITSIPLPPDAEIISAQLIETEPASLGSYNIPIALVEAFSQGGIRYTTMSDIDFPFPADADLVQYQRTSEGVNITLFPIQHNPSTDETWFYKNGTIEITYRSLRTLNITEFSTDKSHYHPGEEVNTRCVVANVGDSGARLKAILQIRDMSDEIVSRETVAYCDIEPGGMCELSPATWIESVPDGTYRANISIENREGATVAAASAEFSVVTGEITELAVPETLASGETGTFRVRFASYMPDPVKGEVFMTIQNSAGMTVEELHPVKIEVAPNEEIQAVFHWTPHGLSAGPHTAVAMVVLYGNEYGPASESFNVTSGICMGNLDGDGDMDGYDLSVFVLEYISEGCTYPCPADLDLNGAVNPDDVRRFAEKFGETVCP